jgi:hypothetical protein
MKDGAEESCHDKRQREPSELTVTTAMRVGARPGRSGFPRRHHPNMRSTIEGHPSKTCGSPLPRFAATKTVKPQKRKVRRELYLAARWHRRGHRCQGIPRVLPHSNWVVGTSHMRAVDGAWSAAGSQLHHASGTWPLVVRDQTVVDEIEMGNPDRRRPRPVSCCYPASEALLARRNVESLARLAALAERRTEPAD